MWEKTGGSGRWTNYRNTDTGENSIKEHKLKTVKKWCANHYFLIVDPGKRLLVCKHCGQEGHFIVGKQNVQDGQLITLHSQKEPGHADNL